MAEPTGQETLRHLGSLTTMRLKHGSYSLAGSNSAAPYNISATVVAGAGGTANQGGGGGAGGMLEVTNEPLTVGVLYTIQVGGGGPAGYPGTSGVNSFFGSTSIAQGGGAGVQGVFANKDGGSGGGNIYAYAIGVATQGNTTYGIGYGNNGGGNVVGIESGGGGGGAGSVGANQAPNGAYGNGGNGGSGRTGAIYTSVTYSTGGGGGSWGIAGQLAGNGGSGNVNGGKGGEYPTPAPVMGTINTGGGGGGSNSHSNYGGSAGGSGVVILKIPTASYSGITTGSPTPDTITAAGFTILKYTGNGSYTA